MAIMATDTRKTKRLKDRITKIQLLQVYQTVGPEGKLRNKDRRVFKEGDTNCRNQIKQVFEEEGEEENYNNEDERSRMVRFSGSQDKGEEVQIFKEDKEEFFKEDKEEIFKKDEVEIFKEGKVEIFKGDKMKLFKADGMKFLYQLRMQVLKTVMR